MIVARRGEGFSEAIRAATDRHGVGFEVDAWNGAVARIGTRHAITTPLNEAFTTLLAAIHAAP